MRRSFLLSAAVVVGMATAAGAQQPAAGMKLSDLAGTWDTKTLMGPKDSVVGTLMIMATADVKGWTLMFPDRKDAVPLRVVASGGDSVVTEAGPYPSYLRPGQTVKLLRTVGHYKGNDMWGTWSAEYASGDKASGKLSAMRKK